MTIKTPITIAYGDGIGPEILSATLKILEASGAQLAMETIEIGEKIYQQGFTSGIPDDAWKSLERTHILLKGPITTPQGGGYKSLNVTLRKTLGLFANVRPCVSYAPFIPTHFPKTDLVIIRENEEDTYAGIEHRQTEDTYQCLKLISRPGCERVIHYAFEYARKFNRKKITCLTKDNIMKMTDGLFHKVFNEIATEYKEIETEHLIVDIGTALVATQPERFDVIVTPNLYGDILSDVAAQLTGSVGLAGSANIGNHVAMFEAIHGSAPNIAGKHIANPSGLLNAAIQMLIHINQPESASRVENAWLKTLEEGVHTADIYSQSHSKEKATTERFTEAVIERLGQKPEHFKPVHYQEGNYSRIECYGLRPHARVQKTLIGIDVFLDNATDTPVVLAEKIKKIESPLNLIVITSRGLKIWPSTIGETSNVHHVCCRFQSTADLKKLKTVTPKDLLALLTQLNACDLDIIKTENLYLFNGEPGFTLAQGQ